MQESLSLSLSLHLPISFISIFLTSVVRKGISGAKKRGEASSTIPNRFFFLFRSESVAVKECVLLFIIVLSRRQEILRHKRRKSNLRKMFASDLNAFCIVCFSPLLLASFGANSKQHVAKEKDED